MNAKCEAEIELEQRERPEEGVAPRSCGRAASVGSRQSRTARPSLAQGPAGQSAGSPPRIHPPAAVAEYVIARKTSRWRRRCAILLWPATARCCGSGFSMSRQRGAARRIGPRWCWSRTGRSSAGGGRRGRRERRDHAEASRCADGPRQYRDGHDVRTCRSRRANALAAAAVQTNRAGTFATPFRPGASATVGDSRRGWVALKSRAGAAKCRRRSGSTPGTGEPIARECSNGIRFQPCGGDARRLRGSTRCGPFWTM